MPKIPKPPKLLKSPVPKGTRPKSAPLNKPRQPEKLSKGSSHQSKPRKALPASKHPTASTNNAAAAETTPTKHVRLQKESRSETLKKVWNERPRVFDLRSLTAEEKNTVEHMRKIGRWRMWPFFLSGLTAFGLGVYGVQLYLSLARTPAVRDVPADLSDRFDKEAEGYDEKVGLAETLLSLNRRRKNITKQLKGHVLEVAVGTGRNIPYFPVKQCSTVTMLDSSGPMLAVAKQKWKETHTDYFNRVFFKQQSAINTITPPYGAQGGYDTILQTMGLCSTPDPVRLLQNLESVTKQDTGRILLLEHGRSHYDWLNELLDKTASSHALEHGCFWNKDIGKIVQDSGLEVVSLKRYNFGTTWEYELKPRPGMGRKVEPKVGASAEEPLTKPGIEPRSWWWGSWRR